MVKELACCYSHKSTKSGSYTKIRSTGLVNILCPGAFVALFLHVISQRSHRGSRIGELVFHGMNGFLVSYFFSLPGDINGKEIFMKLHFGDALSLIPHPVGGIKTHSVRLLVLLRGCILIRPDSYNQRFVTGND